MKIPLIKFSVYFLKLDMNCVKSYNDSPLPNLIISFP